MKAPQSLLVYGLASIPLTISAILVTLFLMLAGVSHAETPKSALECFSDEGVTHHFTLDSGATEFESECANVIIEGNLCYHGPREEALNLLKLLAKDNILEGFLVMTDVKLWTGKKALRYDILNLATRMIKKKNLTFPCED